MTVNAPKKAPKLDLPKAHADNKTIDEAAETSAMTAPQITDNIQKILNKTGALPEDTKVLIAETKDQLETEAVKAGYMKEDAKLDTLTLEQLDHQRTLSRALGLGEEAADPDKLYKDAVAHNDAVKLNGRDKAKDEVLESIPANWRITKGEGDNINAVNIHTGRVYEGPAKGLYGAGE